MRRVIFRADGNAEIGLGHVYRSLALAEMLKGEFELVFLIVDPIQELRELILQTCNKCIELTQTSKIQQLEEVCKYLNSADITVLDGYNFDGSYQLKVREYSYKVISIDDMHQGHFYSDYVLNHCGALSEDIYITESYTKFLLGEKFALLRSPFLKAARNKKNKLISKPYKLFLCMGGSDYYNITSKVMHAIEDLPEIDTINIVLGAANRNKDDVQQLIKKDERYKVYQNLSGKDMCKLMKKSDIAITPGSSISFEVCSVGMGFLSGYYTDNQHDIVNWLQESGCATIMGDFRSLSVTAISHHLNNFFNKRSVSAMIKNQRVIDGYSNERLLSFFKKL